MLAGSARMSPITGRRHHQGALWSFRTDYLGQATQADSARAGIWHSADPEVAALYAANRSRQVPGSVPEVVPLVTRGRRASLTLPEDRGETYVRPFVR